MLMTRRLGRRCVSWCGRGSGAGGSCTTCSTGRSSMRVPWGRPWSRATRWILTAAALTRPAATSEPSLSSRRMNSSASSGRLAGAAASSAGSSAVSSPERLALGSEEGFCYGQIAWVGDLDVGFAALDYVDRGAGEVAEDYAAVVGGGEVRIGSGQLVVLGDHREAEALRGLGAEQRLAGRDVGHHAVCRDDDRVRTRDRGAGGVVGLQRGHAAGDDLLADQRAGGVMEEDAPGLWGVPEEQVGQGVADRVRAGDAALDDGADLVSDQLLRLGSVGGGHDEEHLVDAGGRGEGCHAVLDERLAAQGEELLGHRRAEPVARAAAEHHRHRPCHRHTRTLAALCWRGYRSGRQAPRYAGKTAHPQEG